MILIFSGNLLDPERGFLPTNDFVAECLIKTEAEEARMKQLLIQPMSALKRRCLEAGLDMARKQLNGLSRLYAKTKVHMN